MKKITKCVYMAGKDEDPKHAMQRQKKLIKLAKKWNCSEAGVFRRLLDEVVV